MFSKILIANRGIIRLNCIRAIQELGAKAAVLYTTEEAQGVGVRMADEAYPLTGSKPGEEYYNEDAIVQIARACGADAVHPGYGFLAQSPRFAKKLADARIRLISSIDDDKTVTKDAAIKTHLPVVPGSDPCANLAEVRSAAKEIGYPMVLKAVAGYSGRGIRIVHSEAELATAYDFILSRIEALRLSRQDMYIERYFHHARHIEVPVLRDKLGNVVVLPELDSSVQRRFQKFIVETPSPLRDRNLLKTLASMSRKLVEKLDFVGFTSVEFLVADRPWFLELNTFIQPAHVATNEVAGVDVIKEQIRIFAGEPLAVTAEDVHARGHAITLSVNAEEPLADFAPSPGIIKRFDLASGTGITVFATAHAGDTVSSFYDPTIAQAVFVDRARAEALARLRAGLGGFVIEGIKTNLPFLKAVTTSPEFEKAEMDISFINDRQHLRKLLEKTSSEDEATIAAVIAALTLHNDAGSQHILDEAQRAGNYSIWNFASRFLGR
jgi:pyruvate carboxylase subunit A